MADDSFPRPRPLVVLVDDDNDLRAMTRAQLADDFDVIEAEGGQQGVAAVTEHRPDVVVLDLGLPDLSGFDVLAALSKAPETSGIPIVVLSATTELDERVKALQLGATDYVTKPHDSADLAARIGAAMRVAVRGSTEAEVFEERLQTEVGRARRSGADLSLAMIEMDESRGPTTGAFERVEEVLRAHLRAADALFWLSSETLALVLPDTELPTAFLAAERLREAVAEATGVTLSVGAAELPPNRSGSDLVDRARAALEHACESGGDRTWRADDPRRRSVNTSTLAEDLSEREWHIVSHLMRHHTEQEIAKELRISSGTVRSHKARIRRKLQVPPDARLNDYVRANADALVPHMPTGARAT